MCPPPGGRSSPPGHPVVDGWRRDERPRDTPQSLLRALVSSAKPTTAVQVETTCRPPDASTRSLRMPTEQGHSTPGSQSANASIATSRRLDPNDNNAAPA